MLKDMSVLDEEKFCPHCKQQLSCCEAPPFHIGDGLGWGAEVLFICLNDDCPLFVNGWKQIETQYGHRSSYRYMELPRSKEGNVMMVANKDAFTGSVIDKEALLNLNERYQKEKEAVRLLLECVEQQNTEPVMTLLLDEAADLSNREAAVPYLIRLNDLSCIDPLRNHSFRNNTLEQKVNLAISTLLKANFKKECPYCAEIIKAQAKKCMHCKETL